MLNEHNFQPGDVLLLWNMPYPFATSVIRMVQGGEQVDHCAVVLRQDFSGSWKSDLDDELPVVWEAQPPRVRWLPLFQYTDQMDAWSSERPWWWESKRKFYCEVWRSPAGLHEVALDAMLEEARKWEGVKYGMVMNWLFRGKRIHCSEFVARLLSQLRAFRGAWADEYSRVKPLDVRNALKERYWEHVWTYTPGE